MQEKNNGPFSTIADEIKKSLGKLLVSKLYIAIVDKIGFIYYIDKPLDEYTNFIKDFVNNNFNLLEIGDHSFPLTRINLAFFKISKKAMIILHTLEGPMGQLLVFKTRMFNWSKSIDDLIDEIEINPAQIKDLLKEAEPAVINNPLITRLRIVPTLIKNLSGKEKFSFEVGQILHCCDGEHTIDEICETTKCSQLKVEKILRYFQKKKWLKLKRVL